MQAANAGVTVKSAVSPILMKDISKTSDKFRQSFRRNGSVLHEGYRLAVTGNTEKQWNGGPAHVPKGVAKSGFQSSNQFYQAGHFAHSFLQAVRLIGDKIGARAAEFHH